MTDYIEALRCVGLSKRCDTCEYGYRLSPDSECNDACDRAKLEKDAADAIGALQAEADALAHDIERYVGINAELTTEIEALQAEVKKAAKRNAELHAELEKWVSAAEQAGEPKRGHEIINPYESTWAIENGYI